MYDFAFQSGVWNMNTAGLLSKIQKSEFKPPRNVLENLVVPFDAHLCADPSRFTASGFGWWLMRLTTFPAAAGAPGAGGAAGMAVVLSGRPGWLCQVLLGGPVRQAGAVHDVGIQHFQ